MSTQSLQAEPSGLPLARNAVRAATDDIARRPGDTVRVIIGVVAVLCVALAASTGAWSSIERDVLRLVADLPDALAAPVADVATNAGLAAMIVAAASCALLLRRRLAADLALAATLAWAIAEALQHIVTHVPTSGVAQLDRTAPTGFPSAPVAVLTVVVVVIQPFLPRWARRASWLLVTAAAIGRLYAGADLPLEVIGGVLAGWTIGAGVRLARGTRIRRISADTLRIGMTHCHVSVDDIQPLRSDARGSEPFLVSVGTEQMFVKVVGHRHHDADILYRIYRFLAFRHVEDVAPFTTAKQAVEHEAYLGLLAARSGARVPSVVFATATPDGTTLLVEEAIDGESLDHAQDVDDIVLVDLWQQVAKLQSWRIAHRDLRLGNVLVDRDGKAWILDFGFSAAAATDRLLALDVAELLTSTATLVGPERAVAAARQVISDATLILAVPFIQPAILSATTRRAARAQEQLITRLRECVSSALGIATPRKATVLRFGLRPRVILAVIGGAFALYTLLPAIGGLGKTLDAIRHSHPLWLAMAVLTSAVSYFASAIEFNASVPQPLPVGQSTAVQLAMSFANRLAPAGLGRMAVGERYMEAAGVPRPVAIGALSVQSLVGAAIHVVAILAFAVLTKRLDVVHFHVPARLLWFFAVGAAVAVGVVTFAGYRIPKRRLLERARQALAALHDLARSPRRLTALVGGGVAVTLLSVTTLWVALQAFGADASFVEVGLVFAVGGVIGNAVPTPGGLGAFEAAAVAGLIAAHVDAGAAVAGVLTFRLVTFWLPTAPGAWAFARLRRAGTI
jgi:undecaprenyl-diphosphatase